MGTASVSVVQMLLFCSTEFLKHTTNTDTHHVRVYTCVCDARLCSSSRFPLALKKAQNVLKSSDCNLNRHLSNTPRHVVLCWVGFPTTFTWTCFMSLFHRNVTESNTRHHGAPWWRLNYSFRHFLSEMFRCLVYLHDLRLKAGPKTILH